VVEPVGVLRYEIVATINLNSGTAIVVVKVIFCNDKSTACTIKCQSDIFFSKKSIQKPINKDITIGLNSETVCLFSFKLRPYRTCIRQNTSESARYDETGSFRK
jgi:hypothetical protein